MTDTTPLASEQITPHDLGPPQQVVAGIIEDCLARHGVDLADCEGTLDDADQIIAHLAALSATHAPSDQDASQAQGEVERLAQDAERLAAESTSRIDAAELRGFATGLRRAAALPPAPGATAQDGMERCSFCDQPATTSVADDSDTFDCCGNCEAAWQRDPGFVKDQRPTPTIPAGMVADIDQQASQYAAEYVMATEGNDYVPTEWERELIEDALHGFIAYTPLAAAPKQAEQQGVGQ